MRNHSRHKPYSLVLMQLFTVPSSQPVTVCCLVVSFDYCRLIELDYIPMEAGFMVSMRPTRGYLTQKSPERHSRSALHRFLSFFLSSLLTFFPPLNPFLHPPLRYYLSVISGFCLSTEKHCPSERQVSSCLLACVFSGASIRCLDHQSFDSAVRVEGLMSRWTDKILNDRPSYTTSVTANRDHISVHKILNSACLHGVSFLSL